MDGNGYQVYSHYIALITIISPATFLFFCSQFPCRIWLYLRFLDIWLKCVHHLPLSHNIGSGIAFSLLRFLIYVPLVTLQVFIQTPIHTYPHSSFCSFFLAFFFVKSSYNFFSDFLLCNSLFLLDFVASLAFISVALCFSVKVHN